MTQNELAFNQEESFFEFLNLKLQAEIISFEQAPFFNPINLEILHTLSTDYCFSISLLTQVPMEAGQLLLEKVCLKLYGPTQDSFFYGVVAEVAGPYPKFNGVVYDIKMHSLLYTLKLNQKNRVFIDKTIIQIIESILHEYQFIKGKVGNFEIITENEFPILASSVQVNETDFDFLNRMMAYWGFFYYFEQNEFGAKLIITDNNFKVGYVLPPEIMAHHTKSRIFMNTLPEHISWGEYDPENPRAPLILHSQNKTAIKGRGEIYEYGNNFINQLIGERLIALRHHSIDWQRKYYSLLTTRKDLRPGIKVIIVGHPECDFNGPAFIIAVNHRLMESGPLWSVKDNRKARYQNEIFFIKANQTYKHPSTQRSIHASSHGGRLETIYPQDKAYLDKKGQYRFKYNFDTHPISPGLNSPATPFVELLGGSAAQIGCHYPNLANTELELGFINGDVNRPFILGSLFDGINVNMVTEKNPYEHILKTPGQNLFLMSDKRDEEQIVLSTQSAENTFILNAKKNQNFIKLSSIKGELYLENALESSWTSQENLRIDVGKNYNKQIENNYHLVAFKNIHWKAANNFYCLAFKDLNIQVEENLKIIAEENSLTQADELHIQVETGDFIIKSLNGSLLIQADQDFQLISKNQSISFSQKSAFIKLENGELSLSSPTRINIKGEYKNQMKGEIKKAESGAGASCHLFNHSIPEVKTLRE
ncbi:MAG: hypothetical protein JWM09_286 [Francisellaceae bacterium]|nr:hypothetical protein [Francisellaceae bacterium]